MLNMKFKLFVLLLIAIVPGCRARPSAVRESVGIVAEALPRAPLGQTDLTVRLEYRAEILR